MAGALPESELLIIGRASHLALLGKPDPINDALVRLVKRATPGKMATLTRRLRERSWRRG
jgi:hypothetical protein